MAELRRPPSEQKEEKKKKTTDKKIFKKIIFFTQKNDKKKTNEEAIGGMPLVESVTWRPFRMRASSSFLSHSLSSSFSLFFVACSTDTISHRWRVKRNLHIILKKNKKTEHPKSYRFLFSSSSSFPSSSSYSSLLFSIRKAETSFRGVGLVDWPKKKLKKNTKFAM